MDRRRMIKRRINVGREDMQTKVEKKRKRNKRKER